MKLNVSLTSQEVQSIVEDALRKQFSGKVIVDVKVSNRGATALIQDKETEIKTDGRTA